MDNDYRKFPLRTRIGWGITTLMLWFSTFSMVYVTFVSLADAPLFARILSGVLTLCGGVVAYMLTFVLGVPRIVFTGYEWKD